MISRKQVYSLLSRLEKVSAYISRKGQTLVLADAPNSLTYSLSGIELGKFVSSLDLAILSRLALMFLQKEKLRINISYVDNSFSVVVMNSHISVHFSSSQMAIALLECFVQFKEMEVDNVA